MPGTDQDTCRAPAYPWHGSGYLQGTCIRLARIRVPAGPLHTPGTDQGTVMQLLSILKDSMDSMTV